MKKIFKWILILIVLALLVGLPLCGKPPAAGGPPMGGPATVVVGLVKSGTIEDAVELVASLEAPQYITLVAELDAELVSMNFKEGEEVSKGHILFVFDQIATRAKLDEAEAGFRLAKLTYDRNADLLKKQVISQEEFDQTETEFLDRTAGLALAKDAFENTEVKAPFSGVVGERKYNVGQFISRGSVLADLVSAKELEVVFAVPERYLPKLKLHLPILFTSSIYADQPFEGTVSFIAPRVDAKSRTVLVKAVIKNDENLLRPGQFGQLRLVLSSNPNAVMIPESSVILKGREASVIVVGAEGASEFRPVLLGKRSASTVEVLEGLDVGEKLVVEGIQKVFFPGQPVLASPESVNYGVEPSAPPAADPMAETPKEI